MHITSRGLNLRRKAVSKTQLLYACVMSQATNERACSTNHHPRQEDHKANTDQEEETSYILALHTDPEHHARVTALRTRFFPPKLNKLDAHIALFRALPGSQLSDIERKIVELAQIQHAFPIVTGKPFMMAHGVGLSVQAPQSMHIYKELKGKWEGFLSKQDKSFKPHYTVQNKVEKGVPEKTMEAIGKEWQGSSGEADGLTLWRYDRGYWTHMRDFMFRMNGSEGVPDEQ